MDWGEGDPHMRRGVLLPLWEASRGVKRRGNGPLDGVASEERQRGPRILNSKQGPSRLLGRITCQGGRIENIK